MNSKPTKKSMCVALVILIFSLGSMAVAGSRSLPFVEGSWTLVVLPDTQFYTKTYPEIFRSQTRWVADHKDDRNIAFVLHEGDVTDGNSPGEWEQAGLAMSILDAVGVPYAITPGNHDYYGNGLTRETLMNSYFPFSLFFGLPTFGGVYEPQRMENSYHLFEAGGKKYVILALEFGPRDEVLSWANQILLQHANRTAIIVTHAYTYSDGTRLNHIGKPWQHNNPHIYGLANLPGGVNDGQEVWDKILAKHENMAFVFSGHITPGSSRQMCWGVRGNTVHEMLADFQDRPLGGEGYMRLLEFLPDGETVQVLTYSPYFDLYLTDKDNQFTFPLSARQPLDIEANGQDGPVTVASGTPVTITVGLDPGNFVGANADWWVAVHTPFDPPGDWYTYVYPAGWMPGVNLCAQTGLFDLAPFEVLRDMILPIGTYTFYFALDDPDGMATGPWWGLDSVEVQVKQSVSGWWDMFVPLVSSDKIDAMYLTQEGSNLTGTNILSNVITGTIVGNAVQLLFDDYACDAFSGTLTGDTITGIWDSTIPGYFKKSTFHISNFTPGEEIPFSNPQFAWTNHSGADKYLIRVMRDNPEGDCNETHSCVGVWEMENITQTDVTYNSDGTASEALVPGNPYRVKINAYSGGFMVNTTMDVHFGVSGS